MGSKADRALVAAYYEAELTNLLERIADAIEQYRVGQLDVFEVDDLIHRYKKATRELWKFCWMRGSGSHVVTVARLLDEMATEERTVDWWEEASPRPR